MRNIVLNGSSWKTTEDFYDAFLSAVGEPSWHGRNFNALRDSIITGNINEVDLPYKIYISGLSKMPAEPRRVVMNFCSLIQEFRSEGHIATIPSKGFEWYLIFLEGAFADDIKQEIDAHFLTSGA